jgi:hypothetical protein
MPVEPPKKEAALSIPMSHHNSQFLSIPRMTPLLLPAVSFLIGCSSQYPTAVPDAPPSDTSSPTVPSPIFPTAFQVPASIAADCSVDVTAALHAWIASVPDSSTLVFGKDACYNIDGGLAIPDRHGLTFDGNGSTFKLVTRGTSNRSNWTIQGGSDINLRNMTARGANPYAGINPSAYDGQVEWQHAFRFQGTQTGMLDNVQGYDVYGDFVEAEENHKTGVTSRNLTVRNSRFERNGRQGIALIHVDGFVLLDRYLGDINMTGIDIELNGDLQRVANVRIMRNTFGRVKHALLSSHGQGTSTGVSKVMFSWNKMTAPPVTCLAAITLGTPRAGVYWSSFSFDNNTLKTFGNPMDLQRLKNVTIRNNAMEWVAPGACRTQVAVWAKDSHDGLVSGNTMSNAQKAYTPYLMFQADTLTSNFRVSANTMR